MTQRSLLVSLAFVALASAASLPAWAAGDAAAETKDATRFYLVGVGPGDPDLITVRALRAIDRADVIVCTRTPQSHQKGLEEYFAFEKKFSTDLKGKELVYADWFLTRYYGQDPEKLPEAKRRECEEIATQRNEVIATLRRALDEGKTIAVLSKGDPLIYGPHAWYVKEFQDVNPVVIPGLSAFNAANAALKTNVTAGEHTRSVILTAGYGSSETTDSLEKLSAHGCTLVAFTMGTDFTKFVERVSAHYPPETPIAVVSYAGYMGKENVVQATLGTVLGRIDSENLPFEYLIYVGSFLEKPAN